MYTVFIVYSYYLTSKSEGDLTPMKQHEKLLLCETLYLLAYGYILNGYTAAAIFLAVIPLFIMILEHSLEDLLKHYLSFLFFSGLFLYFSYIYRIEESYKGFSLILLLHISTCSFMTSYSFSALRYFLKINFYLSTIFLRLCFVLGDLYDGFFIQRIIIILLIFSPFFTSYIQKLISAFSLKHAKER